MHPRRINFQQAGLAACLLLCLALPACRTSRSAQDLTDIKAPHQIARQFKYEQERQEEVDYLLYLPEGFTMESSKKWPLILFLHGAGERGADVWKVATHGPPHLATNNFPLPFILVSPQCKPGRVWSNDLLLGLLDRVEETFPVDTDRVYLTGLSMGGYGTWNLGLAHPERFAAIAPICGGGDIIGPLLSSREKAAHLKRLGIWAFHGAKDPVVPLAESERMVKVVKQAGVKDVRLTVYPEAGHNSWTQTYTDPALYEWLLSHSQE